MGKLSKYEKETIVNFNEADREASIYTFNADLKRRLAEFAKNYPLLCRLEKSTPEGSVTYVLDSSQPDFSFEQIELAYYTENYSDFIEAQNARNEKNRHTERNRTVGDLLKNNKTGSPSIYKKEKPGHHILTENVPVLFHRH